MPDPKESVFETIRSELLRKKDITERNIFRLTFMSICDQDHQRAKELKGTILNKLGKEAPSYAWFEAYMTAICDEVEEREKEEPAAHLEEKEHEATP